LKKRSSWLPGSRSRSRNRSQEIEGTQSAAWIRNGGTNIDYSLRPLVDGQKVCLVFNIERLSQLTVLRFQSCGQRKQTA
jgi:hypothetical protein